MRWLTRLFRRRFPVSRVPAGSYELPDCPCATGSKLRLKSGIVAQRTALAYGQACHELDICYEAANFVLEETFICMITQHTLSGTAIEHGSEEARWEAERTINGLEARLLTRLHQLYDEVDRMTSEDKEVMKKFAEKIAGSVMG